ncbi:MAG: hypothetical protein DME72_02715, partial [Verrucomicrobia bacterium]
PFPFQPGPFPVVVAQLLLVRPQYHICYFARWQPETLKSTPGDVLRLWRKLAKIGRESYKSKKSIN